MAGGHTTTPYRGASAHYTSPGRRDEVKRHWEEPASTAVLARAVGQLPAERRPLRVLDVGAGTGDGLRLLRRALRGHDLTVPAVEYVGLDADAEMVATARELHRDDPDATFEQHDVRHPLPAGPVDLVMSAGVPFSHLTPAEMHEAVVALVAATRGDGPTVLVVDVLGRYSVEWPRHWGERRWTYAMSFFSGIDEVPTSEMTTYARDDLLGTVDDAVTRAGARLVAAEFDDRAVAVGRHTDTLAFNDAIPRYRALVNELLRGEADRDLDELAFRPPDGDAPDDVHAFFAAFSEAWNVRLADTAALERRVGAGPRTRTALARSLRALEHGLQRGLGVGHSLTGVFVVA
jgi:SAM-dependent methyltransferase